MVVVVQAFAFGGDTISSFEGADVGMSWDFVNVGAFPFSASLIMMAVDSFLYFFIAWFVSILCVERVTMPSAQFATIADGSVL